MFISPNHVIEWLEVKNMNCKKKEEKKKEEETLQAALSHLSLKTSAEAGWKPVLYI